MKKQNFIIIFSGLPGTGKTTLSKIIAKHFNTVYFRLDTIEQALRELCSFNVQGEGYELAYLLASENLKLLNNVLIDSCNPWALTRNKWNNVAQKNNAIAINLELVCTDKTIHKNRIANRTNDIPNLNLPSWEKIQSQKYDKWDSDIIKLDTAYKTISECADYLITNINNILQK